VSGIACLYSQKWGVVRVFASILVQSLTQMKDHVCTSHWSFAGSPEQVALCPEWEQQQGNSRSRVHWGLWWQKGSAEAVWNPGSWNSTFMSQNCALAAGSCGCSVASSRHPCSVQGNWLTGRWSFTQGSWGTKEGPASSQLGSKITPASNVLAYLKEK
jgi:hypothetical protein